MYHMLFAYQLFSSIDYLLKIFFFRLVFLIISSMIQKACLISKIFGFLGESDEVL
jgi:hypothetical protein